MNNFRFTLLYRLWSLLGVIRKALMVPLLWVMLAGIAQAQVLSEVRVEGNNNFDADLIQSVSGLRAGMQIAGPEIGEAIRQLYKLGYFSDITIKGPEDLSQAQIALTIVVEEYPILERLELTGNKKVKHRDLEEQLTLFRGRAVSPLNIRRNAERILAFYQEKGFFLAQVDHQVEPGREQGRVVLKYTITEGRKVQVKKIFVEGNQHVSSKKIRKQMKTKEDRWWRGADFNQEKFEADLRKIEEYYHTQGFREARVVNYKRDYDDKRESMFITLLIDEGPQFWMGTVSFEGNKLFSDAQLLKQVTLKEQAVFNEDKASETLAALYEIYTEEGYLYAQIQPREYVEGNVVNLVYSITEGTPARVRMINIVGNTRTKEKVIRREMVLKPGQVFKRSALLRSQREIFQLNFFQDVVPSFEPDQSGDVNIIFTVTERPTGTANVGAGFSEQDGLIGTVGVAIPNFLGNGQRVDFNWEFGPRRDSILIGFTEPWLLDTPTSAGVDLFSTSRRWFSDFRIRRTGVSLRAGRRLKWPDDYFRVFATYRIETLRYTDFGLGYAESQKQMLQENDGVTSSVIFRILRDSRDFPQFATSGSRHILTTEWAGGALGGNVAYQKQLWDSEWYLPTFKGMSLAFKLRTGIVGGIVGQIAPFSERFFPGGVSFDGELRGYRDRSVGPYVYEAKVDSLGQVTGLEAFLAGGRSMLLLTLEYQIPIVGQRKTTTPIYGLLFAEAGNAWSRFSQMSLSPKNLKKSLGFGFRVTIPLAGTIGFDFAYGFDTRSVIEQKPDPTLPLRNVDESQKRSGWNTHFQIGQQFY